MIRFKKIKSTALLLAGLVVISGCGSKKAVTISDYGNVEVNEEDLAEDEADHVDEGEAISLSEKLGGKELKYEKPFTLDGRNAKVNAYYRVEDTDLLYAYKITPVSADVREDEMVQNILGDSAKAIKSDDRKYLNEELGDSHIIVRLCQEIAYYHHANVNWMKVSHPAWTDEDTFYIHTYEGTYNSKDYQMLVSYSKLFKQLYVALYPKKIGDMIDNPNVDDMDVSSADGNLYAYFKRQLQVYNLKEDFRATNKCSLEPEQVKATAIELLHDKLYMDFPEEVISMYDTSGITMEGTAEPQSSELVFYNWDGLSEGNVDSVDINGYMAFMMTKLCDQDILLNAEINRDMEMSEDLVSGGVLINDKGVLGFNITQAYNFEETLTDNVNIMNFEKAMDKFVETADENIDVSQMEEADGDIILEKARFAYYPVPTENSDEFNFIPVWILEAENSKKVTIVRVVVNATDGSFVEAFY
ncbi:MAG: hypothetical protein J5476_12875 [Lachnospiraceae bacterium]|nr:hypothetical protein [Lachnospiraceae bacterium]